MDCRTRDSVVAYLTGHPSRSPAYVVLKGRIDTFGALDSVPTVTSRLPDVVGVLDGSVRMSMQQLILGGVTYDAGEVLEFVVESKRSFAGLTFSQVALEVQVDTGDKEGPRLVYVDIAKERNAEST